MVIQSSKWKKNNKLSSLIKKHISQRYHWNVWGSSAEIPYWWRDTTQIEIVFLIGCAGMEICFNQSEALPRPT